MSFKDTVRNWLVEADQPLPDFSGDWSIIKAGKIRVIMHYEDKSFKEIFIKLEDGFTTVINKKRYFVLPECISSGKTPTIEFYFNNPFPIKFDYEKTKLTSDKLYSEKELAKLEESERYTLANTFIDSSSLQAAFSSNLINKMYLENKMTFSNLVMIIAVSGIVILIILHFTGVIDLSTVFLAQRVTT